jgi:hypothetical protein
VSDQLRIDLERPPETGTEPDPADDVHGTAGLRRRFDDGWEVDQDRYERWLATRGL